MSLELEHGMYWTNCDNCTNMLAGASDLNTAMEAYKTNGWTAIYNKDTGGVSHYCPRCSKLLAQSKNGEEIGNAVKKLIEATKLDNEKEENNTMNLTETQMLEEMIKLQKALDDRILDGAEYPTEKMRIALFVELGEFLNEMPTLFKHWKKTAVDNREKSLIELIDCWHFSISLEINCFVEEEGYFNSKYIADELSNIKAMDCKQLSDTLTCVFDNPIGVLKTLASKFDFTFEEIYNAYIAKNKVNHERQDNNY